MTRRASKGKVSLVLTFRFSSFVSLLRFSLLDETNFGVSDNSLSIPTLGSQRSIVDHQRSIGFHRRQQLHTITELNNFIPSPNSTVDNCLIPSTA
ncbi:hypothetical protein Dimus_034342 [Dionaea muscipula]